MTKWIAMAALLVMIGCERERAAAPPPPTPAPAASPPRKPSVPTELPADFSVEYSSGPVAAWMGARTFIRLRPVDGGGYRWTKSTLEDQGGRLGREGNRPTEKVEREIDVPRETALAIYQEVVRRGFFALDESYHDPNVHDGGVASLEVTAGGRTKSVVVANLDVSGFEEVERALWAVGK